MALLAARGLGKTFALLLMCVEACLQKPNQQVAFIAKTQKQADRNMRQSLNEIFATAPPGLRLVRGRSHGVVYNKVDAAFTFPNGSKLILLGTDNQNFEDFRGMALHGCVVDEAQDHGELRYIVESVLDPAVLRVGGWFVISGTVPRDGSHEWISLYRQAQAAGCAINKTIHDCPRYTQTEKERFCRRAGGKDSPTWKREYLNEFIFSDTRLVVPEWSDAADKAGGNHPLVQVRERPTHATRYVGLDFGIRDLSAAVFGFWDFATQHLHIEAEWSKSGAHAAEMAAAIAGTERRIWEGSVSKLQRWGDNDLRALYQLEHDFGLKVQASQKHGKQNLGISQIRVLISQGQFTVDPSCVKLIASLYAATWTKGAKAQFAHDTENELGHFDLVDALNYLVRNVDQNRNPIPQGQAWTMDPKTRTLRPGVEKRYAGLAQAYRH